jgi:hypothetical protein
MNKLKQYIIIFGSAVVLLFILYLVIHKGRPDISEYYAIDRTPHIYPDYTGTVIPPNIAPLDFMINEKGKSYFIQIKSSNGEPIEIYSTDSKVIIPIKDWKELLSKNRGKEIKFTIFKEDSSGKWGLFKNITNQIAQENIDGYLAYRLIHPGHNLWKKLGIYQRNLQTYDEKPILINRVTDESCMNCHSFCNNDPEKMLLHLRAGPASGTLIYRNGNIFKVDTKTKFNNPGAYPSWHPNGKIIAMSVNKLSLFFHAVGEPRDVLDHKSDIILYLIDSNTITTCPQISDPERLETFPTWSPDGNYLYFCSSPKLESYVTVTDEKEDLMYNKIKYDLVRIRYYADSNTWGNLEPVLSSAQTGLSITEPRISPDSRYILFTMSEYGNFPIYLKSSDVYIFDLKTGKYFKPDVNSDNTDSFHSWSSNGRWFVFSSKRGDGFVARPYFSYIDKEGKVYKPFLLPQEDPEFYSSFLKTYNVPELIKGPVTVSPQTLVAAAYDKNKFVQAKLDPNVKPQITPDKPMKEGKNQPQ